VRTDVPAIALDRTRAQRGTGAPFLVRHRVKEISPADRARAANTIHLGTRGVSL